MFNLYKVACIVAEIVALCRSS